MVLFLQRDLLDEPVSRGNQARMLMPYGPTQANPAEVGYLSIYLSNSTVLKQLLGRQGAYLKNYRLAKQVFHPQSPGQ